MRGDSFHSSDNEFSEQAQVREPTSVSDLRGLLDQFQNQLKSDDPHEAEVFRAFKSVIELLMKRERALYAERIREDDAATLDFLGQLEGSETDPDDDEIVSEEFEDASNANEDALKKSKEAKFAEGPSSETIRTVFRTIDVVDHLFEVDLRAPGSYPDRLNSSEYQREALWPKGLSEHNKSAVAQDYVRAVRKDLYPRCSDTPEAGAAGALALGALFVFFATAIAVDMVAAQGSGGMLQIFTHFAQNFSAASASAGAKAGFAAEGAVVLGAGYLVGSCWGYDPVRNLGNTMRQQLKAQEQEQEQEQEQDREAVRPFSQD